MRQCRAPEHEKLIFGVEGGFWREKHFRLVKLHANNRTEAINKWRDAWRV